VNDNSGGEAGGCGEEELLCCFMTSTDKLVLGLLVILRPFQF